MGRGLFVAVVLIVLFVGIGLLLAFGDRQTDDCVGCATGTSVESPGPLP